MKTIKDINDLIQDMLNSDNLADHAATLLGPRTRGSTSRWALRDLDPTTPLEKVTSDHVDEPLELYCATVPDEFGGVISAMRLEDVLYEGHEVKVKAGEHGYELRAVPSGRLKRMPTNEVYFVVGWSGGERALYTWHPGPPLGDIRHGVNDDTGVKI